jgi:hypothetical protein
MIVAGSATWSIKDWNASVHAVQEYSLNLTRLVQVINALIFFVFGFISEVMKVYEVFCVLPSCGGISLKYDMFSYLMILNKICVSASS